MAKLFPVAAGLILFLGQAPVRPQTNPILNAGFENWTAGKPDHWAYAGITWIKPSSTIRFEGASSVRFEVPAGATLPELRQTVSVTAGGVYSFSCRVLDENPAGAVGLVISWFKGSDYLGKYASSPRSQDQAGWQEIAVRERQAPPDADCCRVSVKTYKTDTLSGGYLYADQSMLSGDLPLSVHMGCLEAVPVRDGIEIRWSTESEVGTCGFNVLRSGTDETRFSAVNTGLIPSGGDGSARTDYRWTDRTAVPGVGYRYALEELNRDGDTLFLGMVYGMREAAGAMPDSPLFIGGFPNPFNPAVHIRFRLDPETVSRGVRFEVLDAAGRRIRTLRDGLARPGENERIWDGKDDSGRIVPAGLYLVRLAGPDPALPSLKLVKVE
ncbi:hypothetical protein JW777_06765 [bacterium]|nr:hypothetical protein [bacterium]